VLTHQAVPPPRSRATKARKKPEPPASPAADGPRRIRGRVVMLVDNPVRGDSRVQKAARSAAAAGWDVILLGRSPDGQPQTWQIGDAEVRLLPMPTSKRTYEYRRTWLLGPLAYPPTGIAAHRTQRVTAWQEDLRMRKAVLMLGARSTPSGGPRLVKLMVLRGEFVAARTVRLWVSFRSRQLTNARRARRRLNKRWDRACVQFWQRVQGDRSWRRLEPRLWDYELAYGKVIDELSPDLIHANDFYMLGVGARATVRARAAGRSVKLLWDAHEFLPGLRSRADTATWLPAHCAYEREFAPYADAVITVSAELARLLQTHHALAETPGVILNAPDVEPHRRDQSTADIRALCGIGTDARLLVYSGAAAPQRGLDIMVEAIPRLDGVHVAFVVAHPPSRYVEGLVARSAELGVADRVHLLPYVPHDQLVSFLASADVGVIPIHHWPNHEVALITKFFEYAHARLPMIISDVRAMAEATRSLGQGEVFRAEDVEDFVRVVKIVLADPARYRSAYDRPGVLDGWTWENQAKALDEVYRRLLPDHPTDPEQSFRTVAPDVTVIIVVRDAMPYLVKSIRSLLDQTIGLGRMEVIAVDEGSTDGSRERIGRFVRLHPQTFKLIQRGPTDRAAATINRALDQATGRYILVLGAGDYLGTEALARLVVAADERCADVVVPRTVTGGPVAAAGAAAGAAPIEESGPAPLSVAAGSAKLIRRQLIETHRLRYREDIEYGGELAFTLACYARAAHVCAVSGYDFHHVVRRADPGDGAPVCLEERLRSIAEILTVTAELIEPGPARDEVSRRPLGTDLAGLLAADFVGLDRAAQENICAGIGPLVERHLSYALSGRLDPGVRLRLWLAQHQRVDELVTVIGQETGPVPPPIIADGGRLYVGYHGFRDPLLLLPDALFRLTSTAAAAIAERLEIIAAGWDREDTSPCLTLAVLGPLDLMGLDLMGIRAALPRVTIGGVPAEVSLTGAENDTRRLMRVRVPVAALLGQCEPDGERWERWEFRTRLDVAGSTCDVPLRTSGDVRAPARLAWRGARPYRINPKPNADGHLIVHIGPVTPRRVLRRITRTLRRV
jgi:glycogen(starch) synthase